MPTVILNPVTLFQLMGVDPMGDEEFRKLLVSFGLGHDGVVEDSDPELVRIEVPANRPDLLCVEAISVALKVFLGGEHPQYTIVPPKLDILFHESVRQVRPFLVTAVLRDIYFTQESYDSFIEVQEKLHVGLGRRRTLVSIGTHDLDKCQPPFTYTAEPPEDIVFVPLMGGPPVNGYQLFDNLRSHQQLARYLPLLEGKPLWPVIRDATGAVCSMPPILNSEKTKIELSTKNVFVDCTAIDYTRALNSVICLCAAFSIYCPKPFTVEQMNIIQDGERIPTPRWEDTEFDVDLDYIRRLSGLPLTQEVVIDLLKKMLLVATPNGEGKLKVIAPATRSDVLHACDVAEDVMIAYGYDKICRELAHPISAGYPLGINEYTDRVRREIVACGWNEILTFSLCATRECFDMLGLPVTDIAVRLKNAKTVDYEIVRTTLLPGLLRVTRNILDEPNTKNTLPLRLFEISDVVLLDSTSETNARNFRRLCAAIADTKSRFQEVHGLLDRFFVINGYPTDAYKLVAEDTPTCIPGQRANVLFGEKSIGWIGVIHPQVLINFALTTPVVAFEIEIQPFLAKHY